MNTPLTNSFMENKTMGGKSSPEYQAAYYQEHKHTKFKEYRRRWKQNPRQKDCERKYRVKRMYKLTRDEHLALLVSQNHLCALPNCKTPVDIYSPIDHDHKCCPGEISCGKCVRGILCRQHNSGLAFFEDRPETFLDAHLYISKGK